MCHAEAPHAESVLWHKAFAWHDKEQGSNLANCIDVCQHKPMGGRPTRNVDDDTTLQDARSCAPKLSMDDLSVCLLLELVGPPGMQRLGWVTALMAAPLAVGAMHAYSAGGALAEGAANWRHARSVDWQHARLLNARTAHLIIMDELKKVRKHTPTNKTTPNPMPTLANALGRASMPAQQEKTSDNPCD
jgi:hypothetical protein